MLPCSCVAESAYVRPVLLTVTPPSKPGALEARTPSVAHPLRGPVRAAAAVRRTDPSGTRAGRPRRTEADAGRRRRPADRVGQFRRPRRAGRDRRRRRLPHPAAGLRPERAGQLPLARSAASRLPRTTPRPAAPDVDLRPPVLRRPRRRHGPPDRRRPTPPRTRLPPARQHFPSHQRFQRPVALAQRLPPRRVRRLDPAHGTARPEIVAVTVAVYGLAPFADPQPANARARSLPRATTGGYILVSVPEDSSDIIGEVTRVRILTIAAALLVIAPASRLQAQPPAEKIDPALQRLLDQLGNDDYNVRDR